MIGQGGVLAGAVVDNGTLTFSGGVFAGSLTGGGSLIVPQFQIFALNGPQNFAGAVTVKGGTLVVNGADTISGAVTISGGALVVNGAETFGSAINISGATLEIGSSGTAGAVPIILAGFGNTLQIDGATSASMPTNTISGLAPGDVIDLAGVGFSPSGSVVLTPGHVLQITENGTTYSLQLNSSISSFQLAPDANVGTDIFIGPVTSISTGHSSAGAVAAGSFQDVYGSANGTVISAGGSQFVYAGGVASGVTIGAFTGFQGIFSGGIASRTTDNGAQSVYSGALAVSTTMSDGGEQDVFSGGTAINIFGNDSEQNVFFGGLAVNATFTSDSTQDVFGVASNTTLSASTQEVESGGTAIGTLVLLGDDFGFPTSGQQFVQGVAISTTLGNSGTLELDFGTAINTVVGSGGGLFGNGTLAGSLLDNGVVSFEAVGNTSFTLSGSGTFEIDGGEAVVNAAGFTGSVTVSFATLQLVGGALAGSRPIAIGQDGTLELTAPGVAGSRPISLVDTGAVVRIDGTSMPTNTISGFSAGDVIDLADVAFVAGASATLNGSNNLAIVAGGSTYHLQFNSSVAGNAFELLPDGNSGISATLAQAVSFVASGVTSSGNSVASGAYQNVYGTANSVTVNAGGFQEVFSGGVTTGTTVSGSASFPAVVGDQQIFAGGTASGTIIEDNGQQDVRGTAVSTVLSGFDAVQNVYSGAVLINTVLIHGTQNVLSGAVVSGEIFQAIFLAGRFSRLRPVVPPSR